MAITKYVAASAPYNHQTFDAAQGLIAGANGVLTGGAVTTAGSVVTVAPITWIQEGLIVESDSSLTASLPSNLVAPYFVAVTVSDALQDNPTVTPTFVQRPQDVDAGTVLVAEWDGQEWRQLPYLQLTEINEAVSDAAVSGQLTGVATGFNMTQDSGHVYVQPGSAYPVDGKLITKVDSVTLTKVAADPNSLDRIDQIVLRKPTDDPSRIATVQYVVGPTFSDSGEIDVFTPNKISTVSSSAPKVVNDPTSDNMYMFYLEGTTLKFRYSANTFSSISAAHTIATGVTSYDAIETSDGYLDVVYSSGDSIYYGRFSTTGAVIYAVNVIYTGSSAALNPKLATISYGSSYYIHVVFQLTVSSGVNQIGYLRLNNLNTVITPVQVLVDFSALLANPSLAKDDNDSILYLAFENQTTKVIYLAEYDASTATATAAPTATVAPFTIQGNTYNLDTAALAVSTGATNPKVRRTASKETYVFWRHPNGASSYGVAAYNSSYITTFGYTAVMQHLYASGENVDQFNVAVDQLNTAYFILREQGLIASSNLNLTALTVSCATEIQATLGTDVNTTFTSRGALVQSYSDSSPATWVAKSSATVEVSLRDNYIAPTDIYLGKYRTSDGYLAVAGTALEEDVTIRRLYEMNNLYAATATVTWAGSSTNLLTVVANMTINFLDRLATYTIPTGSVTIPNGSVCYVLVPDEDESQTLTLVVEAFGKGALDRTGRTAVPLFWAVAGVLYTKFAPYRLDAGGETVVLGEPLSQAAQEWLGLPSFTPNASNHDYSSTNYIEQSDDYNTALGKLDAQLGVAETDVSAFFASLEITPHPTITSRVIVSPSDVTLSNGETRSQILQSLIMNFTGAQIDFGPANGGKIYASDGATVIGTFVLPTVATSLWRWFAVSGTVGTIGSDNRVSITLDVNSASADGSSQAAAIRPIFSGFPIGALAIQALGSGNISAITYSNIVLAGTNQGSGVSGIPDTAQEQPAYTGTVGVYTLSQTPLNAASTFVYVDGLIKPVTTAWTITGATLTFKPGFLPDPNTQTVTVTYLVFGAETVNGDQEVPTGNVDGVNATFTLSQMPPNRTAVSVYLNGRLLPTTGWSFFQTSTYTQVVLTTAPPIASSIYATYLTPIGYGGSGGSGVILGASSVGSGTSLYYGVASGIIEIKSLKAGANVTISDDSAGTLTLNASSASATEVHGSRVSPIAINPATGIVPTTAMDQTWWVIPTTTGGQQITASPMLAFTNAVVGMKVTLKGASPANYLITQDHGTVSGSGMDQNGLCNLTNANAIQYVYDGTYWSENYRRQ